MIRKNVHLLAIGMFMFGANCAVEQTSALKLKTTEDKARAQEYLDTCDNLIKHYTESISREKTPLAVYGNKLEDDTRKVAENRIKDLEQSIKKIDDAWQVCFTWRRNSDQNPEEESACLEAIKKASIEHISGLRYKTFTRMYLDAIEEDGVQAGSTFLAKRSDFIHEKEATLKSALEQVNSERTRIKNQDTELAISFQLAENEARKAKIERIQRAEESIKANEKKQKDFIALCSESTF